MKGVDIMSANKLVYSVSEIAKLLNIGKNLSYDLVHKTGFPKIIIGGRKIVIPVKAFEIWLESNSK